MIQKDSEFLNFNYSQTLEIIYNIDVTKILHIHGTPPRKLIIGHSEGYNVQGDSEEKYYSEKMRKLGITNFRFLIWDDL